MTGLVYADIEHKPCIEKDLEYRARDLSQAIVLARDARAHERAVAGMERFLRERWPRMTDWRNRYRCATAADCEFATANRDGYDVCPLHAALRIY